MYEIFNVSYLITTYGYVGIFIIVLLECSIIFPLPGDSLLFTAGLLAGTTYLNLYILIPLIFIAGFLGANIGYLIGVYIERLHKYSFFRKILKKEHIEKAHKFFEKNGKKAIIISRFIPIIRTFTPIVAGIARMNYKAFIKYNLISSIIWALLIPLVGYYLGQSFPQIKNYLSIYILIIVIISTLPVVYEMIKKKKI